MGGTKLVYQLITRLNEFFPITVLAEDYSEEARKNYAAKNIPLIKTTGTTSTSPWYWIRLAYYIRKNREIIKKYVDDDTLLISSMFPMNAVLSGFPNRKFQYTFEPFAYIHSKRTINRLPFLRHTFCKYVAWRYKALDIASTRLAEKVFTLNEVTAGSIRDVYGLESIPTYAGIDTDLFRPYDSPDLAKKYKGKRVLIHSTDFSPMKGTDLALKALAIVKRKYPEVLLLVTSTIQDKRGIAQMGKLAEKLGIRENIEYLGFLAHEDLPRYYSFSEALLQTGVGRTAGATSFSLPAKEALACGTAVIRHPITTEDVEHGISGLLIDPQDSQKYAAGIIYLLDHPAESQTMGMKGREKIIQVFNWPHTIRILLDNIGGKNSYS